MGNVSMIAHQSDLRRIKNAFANNKLHTRGTDAGDAQENRQKYCSIARTSDKNTLFVFEHTIAFIVHLVKSGRLRRPPVCLRRKKNTENVCGNREYMEMYRNSHVFVHFRLRRRFGGLLVALFIVTGRILICSAAAAACMPIAQVQGEEFDWFPSY